VSTDSFNVFKIRAAAENEVPLILELINELAEYEHFKTDASENELKRHLFVNRRAEVYFCESGGQVIGFFTVFFNFSTFSCKPGLYLEDIYVRPEFRGKGAGKAIMSKLARLALENGCDRISWLVLEWNEHAIAFYESLGAQPSENWKPFVIKGDALLELALKSDE